MMKFWRDGLPGNFNLDKHPNMRHNLDFLTEFFRILGDETLLG